MKEDFNYRDYRDTLAKEIKNEPDKNVRRERLNEARETEEYQEAKILHRRGYEEEREALFGGGFIEEAGALGKVADFSRAVESMGGTALLVGGSVRDEIMGVPPKDFDIEIYGIPPDQLRELVKIFGDVNEVGAAFGVLKVRVGGMDIDVSLPRRESKTGRGHRDFAISADPSMSIREAARRRDFTFNSLAKNVLTGEIYDYFGGIQDIKNRILRITDDERFRDDPLRVLRGIQFIGRFGLNVEDRTSAVMREMREELRYLPKERLREEWIKLFTKSRKPSLGLQAAMEWGIFHEMHPELSKLPSTPQEPEWHPEGDVWIHTLMVVDEAAKIVEQERLEGDDAIIVLLAAFCHDFGKPLTTENIEGRIRALGHEEAGADPAMKFLSEIGIEGSLRDSVVKLVASHLKPTQFYIQEVQRGEKLSDGAIKRLAARISPATLRQLVAVSKADHLGRGPFVDPNEPEKSFLPPDYPAGEWLLKRASDLGVYETKPQPVIFGRDLIALGIKTGRVFGDIIKAADELHVAGRSREEIISLISANADKSPEEIARVLSSL